MTTPLNLIESVPQEAIQDSRRLSRFTEQVTNALNALISSQVLNQTGNDQWAIDPSALPPSGVTPGTYSTATITVNSQGLVTLAATGPAYDRIQEDGTNLTQRRSLNFVTGLLAADDAGNTRTNVNLTDTTVTPGSFTNATITVDQQGRITSAASGTASGISPLTTKADIWAYSTTDARFPAAVGDGAIIIQDAAATFGFKWVAVSGDLTSAATGAFTIANDAVTYAKMQDVSAASRLLGRGSAAGSGDPQEISLGSGLTMSGTTLSAASGTVGGGPIVVVKLADTSVNTDITSNDDPDLVFAIGANEVWSVTYHLFVTGNATGDIRIALNTPTGCGGAFTSFGLISSATSSGSLITGGEAIAGGDTADQGTAAPGAGNTIGLLAWAGIINGSTAGNVIFKWAQITSNPNNVTLMKGSFLVAHRVA